MRGSQACPVLAVQSDQSESSWRGALVAERFVLAGRLGRGGMGVVLAAYDRPLGREIALKLPGLDLGSERARELSRKRFRQEAIGLARVAHPNVVQVFGTGEACACHREPFIAMERLTGAAIDERIARDGPFHPDAVVRVGTAIARGLDAVHAAGLVHRDVKPSNIFVGASPDDAKLLDFGLVRLIDRTSLLTDRGILLGSLAYMPPEPFLDQELDARSDVYSLGIVLYEMLTGERPFRADNACAMVMDQLAAAPPPLRAFPDISVSPALEAVVLRCLEKSPAKRFQSARDLAAALDDLSVV